MASGARVTPADFHAALAAIGPAQSGFRSLVSDSSMRGWLRGRRPIPRWVPVLLALMAENQELSEARHSLLKQNRALFTG